MNAPRGGRAASRGGHEREPDRAGVGEHVRGVGEQRQRAGDRPATTSTTMKPSDQPERDAAASGGRRRPTARARGRGRRGRARDRARRRAYGLDGGETAAVRGAADGADEDLRRAARVAHLRREAVQPGRAEADAAAVRAVADGHLHAALELELVVAARALDDDLHRAGPIGLPARAGCCCRRGCASSRPWR